ncbi:MAG: hypothetical protein KIT16_23575, partial [Rhodospirillaceae bacterium]|nr:hypothetical protein [Rhodospirillaceae bacterium]
MNHQRPPGGNDEPTEEPARGERPAPRSPQWTDPDRTQPYTPRRRSIVDRLRAESRELGPVHPETAETLP